MAITRGVVTRTLKIDRVRENLHRLDKHTSSCVLAREVLVVLHGQRRFDAVQVQEFRSLIIQLRKRLQEAFHSVRNEWAFPKFHTVSAFVTQIPDRGVGSTYRGEAKHRYLKLHASFSSRRHEDTIGILRKLLAAEATGRSLSAPAQTPRSCRWHHRGGVARALTEQAVLEYLVEFSFIDHETDVTVLAAELYALFEQDHLLVDAYSTSHGAMIRAGKNLSSTVVNFL